MHIKSNTLKVILGFLFISVKGIFAGTFNLNPSNIADYALTTDLSYNGTFVAFDSTGGTCLPVQQAFCKDPTAPLASTAFLNIGPFNISSGQEWENLVVNLTANTGNIEIYILSEAQITLSTTLPVTDSTTTIDLTQITQLANGASFSLKLVFNGNAAVTSIDVVYSGNTLFCYPAPYRLSTGEELKIIYEADEESLASLQIYDNRGHHVKTIFFSFYISAGSFRLENNTTWDGTDSAGRTVNSGVYTIVFRYVPIGTTGSSYTAKFNILVIR